MAGASGTGKTVTLQVLAEGFSRAGVPVFAADIKGDLSGMNNARGQRLSTGQAIAREVTRSVTNRVAGQIAANLGKSLGGQTGGTIGRAIICGTLGGMLRR